VRQFLQWAVRKDFLAVTHRLGEADGLRPEHGNTAEVAFYSPREFAALLESADATLRPLLAISGLAGLRTAELLRLDWADVWRVPGHIEITASKSKTRQRRLVEVCPALASWLEPYRSLASGKLWTFHEITFQEHFRGLCGLAKVTRKSNGLRHGFCSYHFALYSNENLTAAQAGNSPAMIHAHYKGLATKAEAEKWFNVQPGRAANVIPLAASANK
jgi:integrase